MTRQVRFFPDWGHRWPLWETGDKLAMEPADFGLSDGLVHKLRAWYDEWLLHFDDESGWDSLSSKLRSDEGATKLVEALRVELGPDFVVLNEA